MGSAPPTSDEPASEDDFFRTAGILAHHASLADLIGFDAFRLLAKLDDEKALAIYFALDSDQAKKKVVMRLGRLFDEGIEDLAAKLFEQIAAVNRPRHKIVHGVLSQINPGEFNIDNFRDQNDPTRRATVALLADGRRVSSEAVQRTMLAFAKLRAAVAGRASASPASPTIGAISR